METIPLFIPSYHRPRNVKTARYFLKIGYPAKDIHIFLDSETEDIDEYRNEYETQGVQVHIFDMREARERYDYVHRASPSRRSAGQARNMFYDFAKRNGIECYVVQDDDTDNMQVRPAGVYFRTAGFKEIAETFCAVRDMMRENRVGLFGLSQTGDMYGYDLDPRLYRPKVMNTTFVMPEYLYRGERGVQDDDTSMFTGVMNAGLFTGSLAYGIVLVQTQSATAPGGLTDLYNECKLLNKSLVTPIQFPSAIWAEKQPMNGNRIHHRIDYRYLSPKIIRNPGGRGNIAWDTYPEDAPFTNEPMRTFSLNR